LLSCSSTLTHRTFFFFDLFCLKKHRCVTLQRCNIAALQLLLLLPLLLPQRR
jgi:hypothetical protein